MSVDILLSHGSTSRQKKVCCQGRRWNDQGESQTVVDRVLKLMRDWRQLIKIQSRPLHNVSVSQEWWCSLVDGWRQLKRWLFQILWMALDDVNVKTFERQLDLREVDEISSGVRRKLSVTSSLVYVSLGDNELFLWYVRVRTMTYIQLMGIFEIAYSLQWLQKEDFLMTEFFLSMATKRVMRGWVVSMDGKNWAKTHVALQDQLILSQLAGFLVEDGRYDCFFRVTFLPREGNVQILIFLITR